MRSKNYKYTKQLMVLLLLILTACQTSQNAMKNNQITPHIPSSTPIFSFSLDETHWNLLSYVSRKGNTVNLLPETAISIEFSRGELRGNSGCNTYFASYHTKENTIIIDHIAISEIYCPVPEKLMEQEMNYIEAQKQASSFVISDQRLQITDSQGRTIITFSPKHGPDE